MTKNENHKSLRGDGGIFCVNETDSKRSTAKSNLRRSLLDPVVIAGVLTVAGGIVSGLISTNRGFERDQARCDRAFAFLQDEAISPKLAVDDGFYRTQLAIAQRCSLAND